MTVIESIDPATGASHGAVVNPTSADDVETTVAEAARAAGSLDAMGRAARAAMLRQIAADLEGRRDEIVSLGVRETGLAEARLEGELTRTVYQARFFADVIEDGAYLEATIDHAGDTPMGPGPDLRRMLVPIGPVAVFGASNFPLAFSVPGGDTIAALAAGCPVVVKAHDSHPALSRLTFEILRGAAHKAGAPDGTISSVFGIQAGAALVAAPPIRAVAFTGSLAGGRALQEIAGSRPEPIPFYGEMSSLNPVVLSPGAVKERRDALVDGFVGAVTGSGGQLCTKPGVVLVPSGSDGDAFVAEAAARLEETPATTLLNANICAAFDAAAQAFASESRFEIVVPGAKAEGDGFAVTPLLVQIEAASSSFAVLDEVFGPASVIVRYDESSLRRFLDGMTGSLTATIHAQPAEEEFVRTTTQQVLPKAGRLLFDGWPTGVLVSWAQTHGGPWPSTSSQHTSVGATSIRRFLRPVTWQSAPAALLPGELADGPVDIARRVDGVLQSADPSR